MIQAFVVATYARTVNRTPKEHYYRSASSLVTAIQMEDIPSSGDVNPQFFVDRSAPTGFFDHGEFVRIFEELRATNPYKMIQHNHELKPWREAGVLALRNATGGLLP